jgi:integrase
VRLADCERCGAGIGFKAQALCHKCRAADREAAQRDSCPSCGLFLRLRSDSGRCIRCSRICVDCGHLLRFKTSIRCLDCRRRWESTMAKLPCARCGRPGYIRQSTGWCGPCSRRPNPPLPAKPCLVCGELRRKKGDGMCNSCWQRHPDRHRTRVENLIADLDEPPAWLRDFTEFAGERHCVARVCVMLTRLDRLLRDGESLHPQALLERSRLSGRSPGALARTLEEFFVERGLAFGLDESARLARGRRDRRIVAVPEPLRQAVACYAEHLVRSQQRARRTGTHPRADTTIESALAYVRDFGCFLVDQRGKRDWSSVEVRDVEAFLLLQPTNRSRRLGALRGFFRFARKNKLVLVDPTTGVPRTSRQGFKGRLLSAAEQRRLFRRWTADDATVAPNEALVGVLSLLHAASNAEVRSLRVDDVDLRGGTLRLGRRPHLLPMDPVTEGALRRALAHRASLKTQNPHVIVTRATKTRRSSASAPYVTHVLDGAGVSTKVLRQTRVIGLVTSLDPKVAAEILGMGAEGLATYLADDVNAVLLPEPQASSNL